MAAPAPGTLLVAPPLSDDANFRRTVVLLCEHSLEGSFGLILNRPLTLQLSEVLDGPFGYDATLSLGGPVEPNTLHFLHRFEEGRVPGAVPLPGGVCWGGDFEAVQALVRAGDASPAVLRFFLGYAGWAAGQLDAEIEHDGWILTRADVPAVFPDDQEKLWRDVLRRMGGEYALLANVPDDPRMN